MSLGLLIYVITRLDVLKALFTMIAVSSTITVAMLFITIENYKEDIQRRKPFLKLFSFIVVISICVSILLPTSKEAVAIYMVPKIVQNKEVQEISSNAAELLNVKLEEWLRDIKFDKGKK